MKPKYEIDGSKGMFWCIVCDGEEVGRVTGPMGLAVALATVERLNTDPDFFDGWTERANKYHVKS